MPASASPADLGAISTRCARISRLAAVNEQLAWQARRSGTDEALVIISTDDVLRDLAGTLEAAARDRLRYPDDELEDFAFAQAAEALRACCGAAQTPTTSP